MCTQCDRVPLTYLVTTSVTSRYHLFFLQEHLSSTLSASFHYAVWRYQPQPPQCPLASQTGPSHSREFVPSTNLFLPASPTPLSLPATCLLRQLDFFQRLHVFVMPRSICLPLTYFSRHDALPVRPGHCKCQDFLLCRG